MGNLNLIPYIPTESSGSGGAVLQPDSAPPSILIMRGPVTGGYDQISYAVASGFSSAAGFYEGRFASNWATLQDSRPGGLYQQQMIIGFSGPDVVAMPSFTVELSIEWRDRDTSEVRTRSQEIVRVDATMSAKMAASPDLTMYPSGGEYGFAPAQTRQATVTPSGTIRVPGRARLVYSHRLIEGSAPNAQMFSVLNIRPVILDA